MRRLALHATIKSAIGRAHGLTPATALSEFRRYCSELLLPTAAGASLSAFVEFLTVNRPADVVSVATFLRNLPDFRVEGDKIYLRATAAVQQHHPLMAILASRLPNEGSPPSEVKAALAVLQPNFLPVAVGARSLREALEMYSDIIYVEPKERGMWVAKAVRTAPKSDDSPSTALKNAMAICEASAGGDYVRLSTLMAVTGKPISAFFPSSSREAIVHALENDTQYRVWDWCYTFRVRPLPPPRGVHALIDADGVGKETLATLWSALRCLSLHSTKTVVRQPASAPHSGNDVIAPPDVTTAMVVEAEAERLKRSMPVVLKDVVYFCGDHQFDTYYDEVSRRVAFHDANVIVCAPSKVGVVHERAP